MSPKEPRVTVKGSERAASPDARRVGPEDAQAVIDVTVRLRVASAREAGKVYGAAAQRGARRPLSREQLGRAVGASADDARQVEQFAHRAGLAVVEVSLPRRTIVLRGPASAMQEAFGVALEIFERDAVTFRQRTGAVTVPRELAPIVKGVFGLDDRAQAKPHFRLAAGGLVPHAADAAAPHAVPAGGYPPPQLAGIYDFPKATGAGECIALLELGGGYHPGEITTYLKSLGIAKASVTAVSVDGGHNTPTNDPGGPDGEVVLDIEVAAAIAPKAAIAVYFAPNTDRGFLDALTTAVHDTHRTPSVISISWGGPEPTWTAQARTAFNEALQEANAAGIAVCVAAGDDGASDGISGGKHVDFPASSPHALACGGTRLEVNGAAVVERVWNDLSSNNGATGGGYSAVFKPAAWQSAIVKKHGHTGRGVPDVSADADPQTGYKVLVDGSWGSIGGTSAVAPLWAGLIALCNQASARRPGDLTSRLYAASASGFRDITAGNNGGFSAGPGWDACTGLGVPRGKALLAAVWGRGKAKQPRRKRRS
jgi:kumamolisin